MLKLFFFILACTVTVTLTLSSKASVISYESSYETTPIPEGYETTDDAAIWVHPKDTSKSLVLGVSKNKIKEGAYAGLGIYNLQGEELRFIKGDRLNNVDLRYSFRFKNKKFDIAAASNRDIKGVSLFLINAQGKIPYVESISLNDSLGKLKEEPYGLCMAKWNKSFFIFMPMKSGKVFQYEVIEGDSLQVNYIKTLDLRKYVTREYDKILNSVTITDLMAEKELSGQELIDTLVKKLSKRFQLEGCVSDDLNQTLYVGMEQLGVFKFEMNKKLNNPKLILKVKHSKYDNVKIPFKYNEPRITNDIEGLSLLQISKERSYLFVSVQGMDEYAIIRQKDNKYLGSFKSHYKNDDVTQTDGIAVSAHSLGEDFKSGLMVLHDHHNTENGTLKKANYKFLSLEKIIKDFNL